MIVYHHDHGHSLYSLEIIYILEYNFFLILLLNLLVNILHSFSSSSLEWNWRNNESLCSQQSRLDKLSLICSTSSQNISWQNYWIFTSVSYIWKVSKLYDKDFCLYHKCWVFSLLLCRVWPILVYLEINILYIYKYIVLNVLFTKVYLWSFKVVCIDNVIVRVLALSVVDCGFHWQCNC